MIQINPNSLVPALTALVQRALIALLAYLGATGFISDDDVSKLASAFVALILVVWGAIRAYRNNEDKKTIVDSPATLVPASVAVVKK